MLAPYDSPTHIGAKDKYLLGLSLPELILCFGLSGLAFLLCMGLPYGVIGKCAFAIPLALVLIFVALFRRWGLTLPKIIRYVVVGIFKKPAYEDVVASVLQGQPEWLEMKELGVSGETKKLKFKPTFGSKRARDAVQAARSNQDLLESEAERRLEEGSRAVDGLLREGIRMVLKGS